MKVLCVLKTVKIVEIKGLKKFQNVETRWINMLGPLKWVGKKSKTLIAKMVINGGSMKATKVNLVSLSDVDTILGLPWVLTMLESINTSMKFVHAKDVFMCNYVTII